MPPERIPLPDTRKARTARFNVGGHKGYLTVDTYDDGRPAEVVMKMAKTGSTIHGLLDSWAACISIGLQHGVPIEVFIAELDERQFEPRGFTSNPEIPEAKSLADYLAKQLRRWFCAPPPVPVPVPAADPVEASPPTVEGA
jgi:ribonucleoside-diphosphate reductase alpha chain